MRRRRRACVLPGVVHARAIDRVAVLFINARVEPAKNDLTSLITTGLASAEWSTPMASCCGCSAHLQDRDAMPLPSTSPSISMPCLTNLPSPQRPTSMSRSQSLTAIADVSIANVPLLRSRSSTLLSSPASSLCSELVGLCNSRDFLPDMDAMHGGNRTQVRPSRPPPPSSGNSSDSGVAS